MTLPQGSGPREPPTSGDTDADVDTRAMAISQGASSQPLVARLGAGRETILQRWRQAAGQQPFHAGHPAEAVADDLPQLLDALIGCLNQATPPLQDPALQTAAASYARDRFAQGLGPAELMTELRLLRQELSRALLAAGARPSDTPGELLVQDVLDGAATLALAALDQAVTDWQRRVGTPALRLRSQLLQEAHEAIFAWELDGGIVVWNRGAEELYGFAASEALGRSSHALLSTPAELVETFRALLLRDQRWQGELRHVAKDGRVLNVEARLALVTEAGQRYVLEATRDISERRRMEADRQLLLDAVAHDLRAPLTTIRGSAALLQLRANDPARGLGPDEIVRYASRIGAAVQSMTTQIDQLLDMARLRAGQPLELVRHATDLVALATRTATQTAEASGRRIDLRSAVPELVGEWDPVRLERVLANLLANAVKYSPAETPIVVSVDREQHAGGGWARLVVQDQGIGIPAADLERIFERYHRASNVVGRFQGEGIGLAGARQIVEQHGGTISVASQQGQGATFTVRLPLSRH